MVRFVSKGHPEQMKDGWRYVTLKNGLQFVMTLEMSLMPWLCVVNLVTLKKVMKLHVLNRTMSHNKYKYTKYPMTTFNFLLYLDAKAFSSAPYGVGIGDNFINFVDCKGTERSLIACVSNSTSCDISEQAAGVMCQS